MKFCLDDGAVLIQQPAPTRMGPESDATLHMPGPTQRIPEARFTQPSTMTSGGFQPAAGAHVEPAGDGGRRSSALLWIIVALIIGGSGIAIALILTRGTSQTSVATQSATPTPAATSATNEAEPAASTAAPSETSSPAGAKPTVAEPAAAIKTKEVKSATPERPSNANTPGDKPAPPRTVSGGVLNGKAISLPKPAYPAIARSANASGPVNVQVLIDERGNVISAQAVSGHPLLQSAAVGAARQAKFSPTILGGQPVKVSGVITYNFQMQ